MKTLNTIVKVLAALAAIAGTIYVIAAYGDKIVSWAKRIVGCCPWDEGMEETDEEQTVPQAVEEAEVPAQAAPVQEEAVPAQEEEIFEPEVPANTPVASEEDFEG